MPPPPQGDAAELQPRCFLASFSVRFSVAARTVLQWRWPFQTVPLPFALSRQALLALQRCSAAPVLHHNCWCVQTMKVLHQNSGHWRGSPKCEVKTPHSWEPKFDEKKAGCWTGLAKFQKKLTRILKAAGRRSTISNTALSCSK
jgi:hypothetical protein